MDGAARISVEDRPTKRPVGAEPARRCIVTGAVRRKAELLRFVVGPDGRVVPDVAGRLPGRGLWLSPSRNIVMTACAEAVFAKAARRAVQLPDDLDDEIERQLARRLMDRLGLARRAGEAVAGFEQVREFVRRAAVGALFTAADASENAAAKGRALRRVPAAAAPELIECLKGIELGAAFGRDRAIHAAVRIGTLAERIVIDAARLAGFRERVTGPPEEGKQRSDEHD